MMQSYIYHKSFTTTQIEIVRPGVECFPDLLGIFDSIAKSDAVQNPTFLHCLHLFCVRKYHFIAAHIFPSLARLPGTAEGWFCRAMSPIQWHRDTQHHDPESDTWPWFTWRPPSQNPPVSLCQHGL